MGAIGGLLGTAGGVSGTGIKGPQSTSLVSGLTPEQVQSQNTTSTNALASQNALLSALQAQGAPAQQSGAQAANQNLAGQLAGSNGVGNLNSAVGQQQGFNSQLGAANGIGTQNAAIQGLQGIAGQYQNIANGTGPNPAQAMLNQQTGTNVANQASLMAGQRGAGANVGLLARQSAQQGANTQQQAVGQAATMQANQQLNALQGMSGVQQAIGGLGTTQAGMQQSGIGQLGGLSQQQIANLIAANAAVSGQANTMAGQQIGQTNANVAGAQNQQGMGLGSLANLNTANVNMQGNVNSANAGLAGTTMKGQQDLTGGLLQGAGAAAGLAARGGYVGMAEGGDPMQPYAAPQGQGPLMAAPQAPLPGPVMQPPPGPQSSFGQFLNGGLSTGSYLASQPMTQDTTANAKPTIDNSGDSQLKKGSSSAMSGAMSAAMKMAPLLAASRGGTIQHDFRGGGGVKATTPAEKAVKPGNSYANDKVKALLSSGEIVLPRSVTMSNDPVRDAGEFVRKVIAKRKVQS